MTSKSIAFKLGQTGLCVCPGFLSPRRLIAVTDDLELIRARGEFRKAGVGKSAKQVANSDRVRHDETYWLDREFMTPAQALLWRKLDLLKAAFNRGLFLGLTDFQGHYAVYPPGGFYERHKDTFREGSMRVVSFVLYLNPSWQPADGGRLRVYSKNQMGIESHIDIDPVGGTMVCFLSSESEHEVLLSHQPRFSITGWFNRR